MIHINLLPEESRENISFSKKNGEVIKYIRWFILLCLLFAAAFIFLYIFLVRQGDFYKKNISETEEVINDYGETISQAKGLQNKIQSITKIKGKYQYWSKFNYLLEKITPEGVYISALEPDSASKNQDITKDDSKKKMKISGFARTKNDVGLFRDALANQKGFSQVYLESVKETTDFVTENLMSNNFVITLTVDKAVLLKGSQ